MHLPKWQGRDILRPLDQEDENIEKATELRRKQLGKRLGATWFGRYVHRLIPTPNTREKDGVTTLPGEVEYRQFRWGLTSLFLPSEYHHRPSSERSKTPWRIVTRCLFVDLASQLKAPAESIPWKEYPVGPLMPVSWVQFDHKLMWGDPCWGYRAVFSQETRDKPRSLTGSWLVIVYIMAKDRRWLSKVDERTLVTMENLFSTAAFEGTSDGLSSWNEFWAWKRGEFFRPRDRTKHSAEAEQLWCLLDEHAFGIVCDAPWKRAWPQAGEVEGQDGGLDLASVSK